MIRIPVTSTANEDKCFQVCFLATDAEMINAGYLPVVTADRTKEYWIKVKEAQQSRY